jgi:hypothetical protein
MIEDYINTIKNNKEILPHASKETSLEGNTDEIHK